MVYDLTTEFIFNLEPQFMDTERAYRDEFVCSIRDKYDEFIEDFIDDVYDVASLISRE